MAAELDKIYRQIAEKNDEKGKLVFALQGMFTSLIEFDPVTNEPLPGTVDEILHSLLQSDVEEREWWNDRLEHIVSFSSSAVRFLIDFLHEKNLRERRISRPERVREVDSRCMMWLSKKPGFTVKQKIASEQRMMGVYHTTSLDTSENRLFKSFMQRLDDLLLEKEHACRKLGAAISEDSERFIVLVHTWLKSEECGLISAWNNVPPNNTLLNDRNYRKIWKSHLALQILSEQCAYDRSRLGEIKRAALFYLTASRLNTSLKIRFCQTVVFPDYNNLSPFGDKSLLEGFAKSDGNWEQFRISLEKTGIVLTCGERTAEYDLPEQAESIADIADCAEQACASFFHDTDFSEVSEPAHPADKKPLLIPFSAVDLNSVQPTYTGCDGKAGVFGRKLVYQQMEISKNGKASWYSCPGADAKLIFTRSKSIRTFSIHSVFDRELLLRSDLEEQKTFSEKACMDFARIIRGQLCCQKCLYVVSDDADDFSPTVNAFKHSMNASFGKAEILPRSIAAVFTKLSELQNSFHDKDEFTVRDVQDGYEVEARIRIMLDEKLLKRNPETKGFRFQRLAFQRREKSGGKPEKDFVPENLRLIITRRDANVLCGNFSADDFHFEEQEALLFPESGKNEILISADNDTSAGAVCYERLQRITPDIPLWVDILPKLSMVDSTRKEYELVEPKKNSVHPVVGKPVRISIPWHFSFPAGRQFYEFPLSQGEKSQGAKYFAFIKDSSFPLQNETECRLNLTYTYGEPRPYHLEFMPLSDHAEFKSVSVKWENKSHKDYIHDMPVPNFVREYTWEDMKRVPGRKGGESSVSNLIEEWLPNEYNKILNSGAWRVVKQISSQRTDTDVFFLDAMFENGKNPICYIPAQQKAAAEDYVWCYIGKTTKGYQAFDPHVVGKDSSECAFSKSLRFPAITVWNNGRSISDTDCPEDFKLRTQRVIEKLKKSFGKGVPDRVKNQFMFFLSCMHKDMPQWFADFLPRILKDIAKHFDYPNFIAYSLGDCSMEWQQDLLQKTLLLLDDGSKSVFAVKILAKALWRVNEFVFNLEASKVAKLLSVIKTLLSAKQAKTQETVAVRSACLECIVALCRLRSTQDGEASSDKMLKTLSPQANADVRAIVETLEKMKKGNTGIKTFLLFEIDRSSDDKSPELLYAAYGYLSGEIDSNSIKVLEADFGE